VVQATIAAVSARGLLHGGRRGPRVVPDPTVSPRAVAYPRHRPATPGSSPCPPPLPARVLAHAGAGAAASSLPMCWPP